MNVADLTAKIKITIEKEDLGKLSDGLEEVKKKLKEFNKKLSENADKQKQAGEQTEKNANKTEKAAKETEKQAQATEKLAEKTKKATNEMHGQHSIISRIIQAIQKLTLVGLGGGTVLERMYERAAKLGASLRLMSTDFSLDPESLQKWQMMAEQAGVSSDAMERLLASATEMKRLAVQNPEYLPDALNIAGIRPANYSTPEALTKAILGTAMRFRDEQKRMAWLEAAGFKDAAAANLIAKQFAKGGEFDDAYIISNRNVEKLNEVNKAISRINRLSESVKSNFLAAISDDFVSQIDEVCTFIIDTVHAVDDFITRHGGLKKVLGDIGGLASQVSVVANGFATASKAIAKFGPLTALIVGFGVALGVVLKVLDLIVLSFEKAIGLAGTLRQFLAGFIALKIGELIESGAIPPEYAEDAKRLQEGYLAGAGIYQDPKMVTKTLDDILEWLTGIPAKVASSLASVLGDVMMKAVDYLIEKILTMWAESGITGSEWAANTLAEAYTLGDFPMNEQREGWLKKYYSNWERKAEEKVTPEKQGFFERNLGTYTYGTEDRKKFWNAINRIKEMTHLENGRLVLNAGAGLGELRGMLTTAGNLTRTGKGLDQSDIQVYQNLEQKIYLDPSKPNVALANETAQKTGKVLKDNLNGVMALGTGSN